jgi:HrpA-like RNA helicase
MTRDDVATLLHLPSSESLVELGILLGNDYVKKKETLSESFKNVEEAIEFLQCQAADYRVTAKSKPVELVLDFIRALYSFACLDDFPIDPFTDEDEDDSSDHPVLPASLDLSLVAMEPIEFSLRDVMLRPLQAYVDQTIDPNSSIISQLHLDTFIELNKALELNLDRRNPSAGASIHRPSWQDILASYAIEQTLSHIFGRYAGAPVVRYSSPMKMFDALSFHNMMHAARKLSEEHAAALVPAVADAKANRNLVKVKHAAAAPKTNGTVVKAKQAKSVAKVVETLELPIDEFEDEILHTIRNNRVTIIQGETGCGKSSRVPIMILRAPVPHDALSEVKMFISQPRRIAAKALVERVRSCEPDLQHKIALRMGHGERQYETPQTRAWFVTTGYLVRVLANHPERFNKVSHLIVDEVHERSVDSDVLCLLCKRLLTTNKTIRLVLMSATLAANMYADYFDVMEPPIKVGGRRFPIQEFFIEDLMSKFNFPAKDQKMAKTIKEQCEKSRCKQEPTNHHMEGLYQLAVRTTAAVGQPGSSVLIFVPGMHDIVSIIDLVEQLYVPGAKFTCFPIHSDVPFEEQMAAFDTPAADEIKVIIGTNAAESSITLPDVDHVICLGLQKQIVYNPATHRQLLTPAWISQASAIQRAGRTGRVRNGNVYRLYTRAVFEEYMAKFEIGEMSRVPLDSLILDLKQILHEETTPVLLECLEPPELRTIERSFESLHEKKFLSTPDDSGDITNLGSFVSSLGIDLLLGSLIGLGIQFGVGAEAIEIAAILSFSKSPWIISNPLFHESSEFNGKFIRNRIYSFNHRGIRPLTLVL